MADRKVDGVRSAIRIYIQERFPAAGSTDLLDDLSLLDSGIVDSMGILDLVVFIEQEYGIVASDDELVRENFDSISALHTFIQAKR